MPDINSAVSLGTLIADALLALGNLLVLVQPVLWLVLGLFTAGAVFRLVTGQGRRMLGFDVRAKDAIGDDVSVSSEKAVAYYRDEFGD